MDYIRLNINKLIKASEYSIPEMANKIGLTKQSLYNILDGTTSPSLKNLKKIADILEIRMTDFFKNDDSINIVNEEKINYSLNEQINIKDEQIKQLNEQIKFLQHLIEEKL